MLLRGTMFRTMTTTTEAATPTADPATRPRGPLWWRRFRLLPRPMRWTAYAAVLVVLALVAGVLTGVVVVRRSFPQTDGTARLGGLGADVEVIRDAAGVPQIYADTTDDLMRAQGYVAAQERFFEMDVRRHATAGRLAELIGADGLESDLMVRTMGWRRVAEQELPLLDPDTRVALDAYAAGVNAYLEDRGPSSIALEYTVLNARGLDYTPEPWTAVDSLAWLKAMAWDLRGNLDDEVDRALTAAAVGPVRAAQLWPADPKGTPVVRQGAVIDGVFEQDADETTTRLPTRPAPFGSRDSTTRPQVRARLRAVAAAAGRMPAWLGRGDGLGSNAWAVSGEHTDTGAPILADDPHLGVSMPGAWLPVGLHCRTVGPTCPYDVAGYSFAGMPGVLIGHNADIAWGFSNLAPDVSDLFVERIVGDRWRYDGRLLPLEEREERIEVAGGDDVTITVRSTDHGPILSDVDTALAAVAEEADVPRGSAELASYAVSLQWTALEPSTTADAILALDRASDWRSFRAAASELAVPGQNVVYADRDGHIGYQATGRIPIRKSGNDGSVPSAGWRPENDWSGEYVPFDGLPNVLDPDEGFVVAANQRPIGGGDYPYLLSTDTDHGYRSDRIRRLIAARLDGDDGQGRVSVDDTLRMQLDDRNPLAEALVPHLLRQPLATSYDDDGQRLLESWDMTQPAEGRQSAAAAYFNVVWRNLLELTFDDELVGDQRPDGGQRWVAVVTDLLERPDDPWWDDVSTEDVVETRDDVLTAALTDARDELTSRIGPEPDDWTWGALHELRLEATPLGRDVPGAVDRLFDRGGWGASGGGGAVNATGWDARVGYGVTTAPSMRMVVPLDDLDAARWVNLTGVSGHAFHPHHTDQTDLLLDGRTLPWVFSRDAVVAMGEDVLTLQP